MPGKLIFLVFELFEFLVFELSLNIVFEFAELKIFIVAII